MVSKLPRPVAARCLALARGLAGRKARGSAGAIGEVGHQLDPDYPIGGEGHHQGPSDGTQHAGLGLRAAQPTAGDQDHYAAEQLRQTTRQADAAVGTFWVAAVAVAVSFAGLIAAVLVYRATLRQVDVATLQADISRSALPRSWLYVEFPEPGPKPLLGFGAAARGVGTLTIDLPLILHNYGQLPATITFLSAWMFAPRSAAAPFPASPFGSDHNLLPAVIRSAGFEPDWGKYVGHLVAASSTLKLDRPFVIAGVGKPTAGTPAWLYVTVEYKDPLGTAGFTGYLARVDGASAVAVDDGYHTVQR